MNEKELTRLQEGQKLLLKIKKIDEQIASLRKVKFITLSTSKTVKVSTERHYFDDLETEKVVDYQIAINQEDKVPHPFAQPAWDFIELLICGIEHKRDYLQDQFDNL